MCALYFPALRSHPAHFFYSVEGGGFLRDKVTEKKNGGRHVLKLSKNNIFEEKNNTVWCDLYRGSGIP